MLPADALHLRRLLRRARPQRSWQRSRAPRQDGRTDPVPAQHRREHRRRPMRRRALRRQGHRRPGDARNLRALPRRAVQAQGEGGSRGDGGSDERKARARTSEGGVRGGERGETTRRQGTRHRDGAHARVPAM